MRKPMSIQHLLLLGFSLFLSARNASAATMVEPVSLGSDDRPAQLYIPQHASLLFKHPLILFLHGYASSGPLMNSWLHAARDANALGYVALIPEGNPDEKGLNFWNATPDCCNFYGSGRDDVGYLDGLIAEAKKHVRVGKVYVFGHSNGGFMAARLACERSDLLSGIVSLSGGFYRSPELCTKPGRVDVLQIHGTDDSTIPYYPNDSFPAAVESIEGWAKVYDCKYGFLKKEALDLVTFSWDGTAHGKETDAFRYLGCKHNVKLALWTINGGQHNNLYPNIVKQAMDFFKQP